MLFKPYSYTERYGMRLQRLTLDGGFTCPNRDGTLVRRLALRLEEMAP